MSRTLFWYIFKDLIKIFALTCGALAGIMSFGGLLKPLTEHGLNATQVGQILYYFMPAMTSYSLPIAALFATTMVYGRLSADNELTACRACGLSYLTLAIPALLLGVVVAICSLVLMSFVVPVATLKVEQVIYSNLARMVANEIERTHSLRFPGAGDDLRVYAEGAQVQPPDPTRPTEQRVTLLGPMLTQYGSPTPLDPRARPPTDFWMAKSATAVLQHDEANKRVLMWIELQGGNRFPRQFRGAVQGGIEQTQIGPMILESPVRENTKFMTLQQLQDLYTHPDKSQRIRNATDDLIRREQITKYLQTLALQLNGPARSVTISSGTGPAGEAFTLFRGAEPARVERGVLLLTPAPQQTERLLRFRQDRGGGVVLNVEARQVHVVATPDADATRMLVRVELYDARVEHVGSEPSDREAFPRTLRVPMPPEVKALSSMTAEQFLQTESLTPADRNKLLRELIVIGNRVMGELMSRASFAVSCLFLVMVGCALGMMFRSGNFLSAFAVSVAPALLCITLIITGQHTCENVPHDITNFKNPLTVGLTIIWTGNAIVLVVAVALLGRLQRQ